MIAPEFASCVAIIGLGAIAKATGAQLRLPLALAASVSRPETSMDRAFETALATRVDDMLDACTKCGKCFEACPITGAAGVADADPREVIAGVLDIVRMGDGPPASRKWGSSCVLSGEG